MENSMKKIENVQGTTAVPNQSPTGADTEIILSFNSNYEVGRLVDEFQSSNLLINAVDERHSPHVSLDVERMGNSSVSPLLSQYIKLINEHRDSELNELKRIDDIYNRELLLRGNRIKQLTVENNELKNENTIFRAAKNNEHGIVIDECESRIDNPESQLNNSIKEDLNEDCLLEIFSYLSVDDMIQMKRVCKKWYQTSQHWFKQVQTLVCDLDDMGNHRLQLYEKYYKRKIHEKIGIHGFNDLISILNSCGHHIKYFKANLLGTNRTEEREKFVFQWVPKLCKNIAEVEIHGGWHRQTPPSFVFMATHWEKLEKIKFRYLPHPVEGHFYKLLRNNKQLETLELWYDYDPGCPRNDKFFTYLPKTMKEIIIKDIAIYETEEVRHFISASKNFTSLQLLDLSTFYYLTDAVVAAIVDIKSLTHLALDDVDSCDSSKTFDAIANMKGLKSLKCYNLDLHENSLINIVESCIELEHLDLYYWESLTDKGMAAIAKLKRLKCLRIKAKNVTNESIINLCGRLEILMCFVWRINDSDAIRLLKAATNLRFVDFNGSLTVDILQAAMEIANERKNNILCISRRSNRNRDIDTPYFKYKYDMEYHSGIFPEDIRNCMK